jgi:hypothetical protein
LTGLLPALGGGANSVVQLAAGGLSGVLGMSALIASGVVAPAPPAAGPQTLALVGCPGSGSVVAVAKPGDQMLVTGRSADGAWLRVYVPGPAGNDGWAPATALNLLADGSAVPVAGCEVVAASSTPGPTAVPASATPTATAAPTATVKPTSAPTPTPTPTATPNPGPVLASLRASRSTIFASRAGHCVGDPASLSISVTATDANGVGSVALYWKPTGSSTYRWKPMAASGSVWKATLSTQVSGDQLTAKGTVAYYVVAKDASPAAVQTRSPATAKTFKVALCNHPPAVGNIDFGGEIYHGEFPCTTTFSVSLAGVIEPDNDPISSVLFWYRAYGMKTYASATLVGDPAVPGFYSATVYTANWPPMPGTSPTYSIPWYVTATDALGATTKYVNPNSPLIENYCFIP